MILAGSASTSAELRAHGCAWHNTQRGPKAAQSDTPFTGEHAVLRRPAINLHRMIGETMFRSTVTEPNHDNVAVPADLVPLSVLALDLPAPTTGWLIELDRRGIPIVLDHIGRSAISADDARLLLDEQREAEARAREVAKQQEEAAIAADQAWRARLPRGVPWWQFPDGVSPADAWAQAEKDAQPKRRTLLEDAFAREETLVYHSLQDEADES